MKKKVLTLFILSTAGLLFSGYLSAAKLLSGTCAFNESCPYFLGYPACWYGFAMYLVMFVATAWALARTSAAGNAIATTTVVSLLGVVFSGSFVVQEIAASSVTGILGLSTCAYGFIFYVAIFVVSLTAFRRASVV